MKVSLNWLSEYIDISKISINDLSKIIASNIVEIEDEYYLCNIDNLEIGEVLECVDHPNSDHLHVCQVKLKDGVTQIVCGAPNVTANIKVIVAKVGSVLPGDFKIKKSTIRGVESNGMICSLQELGIEEKFVSEKFKNGIYILDEDAEVFTDPLSYLNLRDYVFDLELTSNRSDLLSIEGVAYDIAANIGEVVSIKNIELEEVTKENKMQVSVLSDGCKKYATRVIENVTIKESPNWLKARLIASNVRPINNVVDVTNYVLMQLGQPLHSFDGDKLGNEIVVRNAYENEETKTLDDVLRVLDPSDVVVTDGNEIVAIAGVMGCANTEVREDTTKVVLEAAYFEPLNVRKTSQKLGLKSESSTRFERKVDFLRVERALDLAASLIKELSGGDILNGVVSVVTQEYITQSVDITTKDINKVLGTSLKDSEVLNIFTSLAYDFEVNKLVYTIKIPSRRMDLEPSMQHIIEDVARVYGYNNIPTTLPFTSDKGGLTTKQQQIRNIRKILSNIGLNETVTYSLINENNLNDFKNTCEEPIKLLMPMSEDKAVMRQSLLNGLCEVVTYNKARKQDNLSLFEIGKKYSATAETTLLSGAFSGLFSSSMFQQIALKADFYLVKGVLDVLFNKLNKEVRYVKSTNYSPNFHPGRCATINYNNEVIGVIGELHPKYIKEHDLPSLVVFEINLDLLLVSNEQTFIYKPLSKFPSITRDLAIVVKNNITANEIIDVIKQTSKKLLVDYHIFDVYTGENVGDDEVSLAIKLVFQDDFKTLETTDVDKIIKSVLNRLDFHFKARLR